MSVQGVFLDKSIPYGIRFMAVIQIKNGMEKVWRKTGNRNPLSNDEKMTIRSRLLQGTIGEEEKALAQINAIVTARVVRMDYPQDWPEAFNDVRNIIQSSTDGNQAHLSGALLLLLKMVKEMATARLRKSQTALQAITPDLLRTVGAVYMVKAQVWMDYVTRGGGDEGGVIQAITTSLTSLKLIRYLAIKGFEHPHDVEDIQNLWVLLQTQFGQLMNFITHDSTLPEQLQELVGKHLLQFTKIHQEMAEQHPASFVMLPNSLELVRGYWTLISNFADVFAKSGGIRQVGGTDGANSKSIEGPVLERMVLKGLILMRTCISITHQPVKTFKFRTPEVKEIQDKAVGAFKIALLTDAFVLEVVNVVVTKLFVFRQSDLEAWEEDPEEWESSEQTEGDAWEWKIRPCAERLFLDLLIQYKELVSPPLLGYFQSVMNGSGDIVTKEAIYNAMGVACSVSQIVENFDIDTFVATTLVKDVQIQDPLAKLLRRRIAILISKWVPVKLGQQVRPTVYDIYRHLLNKDDPANDTVVRITAGRQIKWLAAEFNFDPEPFLPYVRDILASLVGLMTELEIDEPKIGLLETIRMYVDGMGKHVAKIADDLVATLPSLWDCSGESAYMIKQSILLIISTLLVSLKEESQRFHGNVVPLIRDAVTPGSELFEVLLDDAVDVWKSLMLHSSPPLSSELINLETLALPLFETSAEPVIEDLLQIIKSYIVLAPEAMLVDHIRRPTLTALARCTDPVKKHHEISASSKLIQYIIRTAGEVSGAAGIQVVVQDLFDIGFIQSTMSHLHEAIESRESIKPGAKRSKVTAVMEGEYFDIFSRIAFADPEIFVKILMQAGDLAAVWSWFSSEWFYCFERMDLDRQKLWCLALTRLCELPQPMQNLVLSKLQDYFVLWTVVVADAQEENANGPDLLVWNECPTSEYDTPFDVAEKNLFIVRDPIHTEHTYTYVLFRLQNLVERTGGEQAFEAEWAVNVDKDVLDKFRALSQPKPAE